MKNNFVILFMLLGMNLYSQIEINNSIILTGNDTIQKQIKGVNSVVDSTNLVSTFTYQNNKINFSESTITSQDSITLTSPLALNTYLTGLQFTFKSPTTNHDSVYVNVNNIGWVLMHYKNKNLRLNQLKTGQMHQIIFDGSKFQLISVLNSNCPVGFTEVNETYCIETNESAVQSFFTAIIDCSSKDGRLCTWNEWYYACQKTGLGLLNMTNNYEWIDSATNSTNQVVMLGNGGCLFKSLATNTTTKNFRCCYSK